MSSTYIVRNTAYMLGVIGVLLISACSDTKKEILNPSVTSTTEVIEKEAPLFSAVSSDQSGIKFNNFNIENKDANYYHYEYFYNGGGVATADFNNDGSSGEIEINLKTRRVKINVSRHQGEETYLIGEVGEVGEDADLVNNCARQLAEDVKKVIGA